MSLISGTGVYWGAVTDGSSGIGGSLGVGGGGTRKQPGAFVMQYLRRRREFSTVRCEPS